MPVMITISGLNTEEVSKILSLVTKLGNFSIETNATNVIYLAKANGTGAKKVKVQVPDPGNNDSSKRKKKRTPHYFTEEEEIFIVQNFEKLSCSEIARELGLRRKQVEDKIYSMKKTGRWDEIKRKIEDKGKKEPLTEEKRQRIIELYRQGKTYREIKKELNVSTPTIARVVAEAGIPMRGKGRMPKSLSNCNYNCQECKYAKPEEVGNTIWCTKFNRRIFLEEVKT